MSTWSQLKELGATFARLFDASGNEYSSTNPLPVISGAPTTSPYTMAQIAAASSGNNTLVSGTASQTIRVYRILLSAQAAVTALLEDSSGTVKIGNLYLPTQGGLLLDGGGDPVMVCTVADNLVLNLGAAINVGGAVWYTKS